MALVIDILQSFVIARPGVAAAGDRSKQCRMVAPWHNRNQSYDPEIVRSGVTVALGYCHCAREWSCVAPVSVCVKIIDPLRQYVATFLHGCRFEITPPVWKSDDRHTNGIAAHEPTLSMVEARLPVMCCAGRVRVDDDRRSLGEDAFGQSDGILFC